MQIAGSKLKAHAQAETGACLPPVGWSESHVSRPVRNGSFRVEDSGGGFRIRRKTRFSENTADENVSLRVLLHFPAPALLPPTSFAEIGTQLNFGVASRWKGRFDLLSFMLLARSVCGGGPPDTARRRLSTRRRFHAAVQVRPARSFGPAAFGDRAAPWSRRAHLRDGLKSMTAARISSQSSICCSSLEKREELSLNRAVRAPDTTNDANESPSLTSPFLCG